MHEMRTGGQADESESKRYIQTETFPMKTELDLPSFSIRQTI